ncbi:MAG: hypothetical protein DMF64_10650 [Acidobacteria bacterium]|nr:MAG: hypothetical protein DMF64_10650 [Acidobacteriota bacterium]
MVLRALLFAFGTMLVGGCDIFREAYYQRTGKSEGTLVANIGMPLEEVEKRSTLKLARDFRYPSGEVLKSEQAVFDLELAGTGVRFERCRYYWLQTRKDDSRLDEIIIYATPSDWSWAQVTAVQQSARAKLSADGWTAGRFVYHTPEAQALHAGETDGYGDYWLKDDVLLMLDPKPTAPQPVGSDPHAGQFTLYYRIYPLRWADHPDLEFPGHERPTPAAESKTPQAKPTRR